jgi:putative glutamine amidotransferase
MKPIIGITVESKFEPDDFRTRGSIGLNWNYFEMVSRAGGVPVVIPPTADPLVVAGFIHGWLIPGGRDIDARRFGEENHESVELQDPSRFEIESALYRAVRSDLPILGICYGCQFLNVAQNGSLIQHLPDVPGTELHTGGAIQRYSVERGSKLGQIAGGEEATGRTYHHQAVGRIGQDLQVVARHEDGTIEGLESTSRPWVVAVQWHPERTPDNPLTVRLFAEFVEAARAYATESGR